MKRRNFLARSGALVAGAAALQSVALIAPSAQAADVSRVTPDKPLDAATLHALLGRTSIAQPPLPYPESSLAPTLSEQTMRFHYERHHKLYCDKVAQLLDQTGQHWETLEEALLHNAAPGGNPNLAFYAMQAWAHNFYFRSMHPGTETPSGEVRDMIKKQFGGLDRFSVYIAAKFSVPEGGGWGWVTVKDGKLDAVRTSNVDFPFLHGAVPLLCLDLWEHAYYLDYVENQRAYIDAVVRTRMNWSQANSILAAMHSTNV
ncbi:superoxide dismutase [Paraburkholderia youngii]|uniref:superoxide dismutase n=1 Tax=Paraburkholderia youngii TaxID=2782701 RepID=UPI003D1CDEB7